MRRVSGVVYAHALCNRELGARQPFESAALKALNVHLSLRAKGNNHYPHLVVVARFL